MKKLLIVESPAKVKTISKYLGQDYKVKASMGHIIDLPKKDLGVDVDKNYKPKYEVVKANVLKEIKDLYEGVDGLVIATDPDREGEAIGWHIASKLGALKKNSGKQVERIVFSSITKDAIQDSIKNPRKIDMDLVNAQQARRVLDRLVGYKLSPLVWKKIRFGLSAGRVQSVAVRLIVDREIEREKFKPEEFWQLFVDLLTKKGSKKVEVEIIKSEKKNEDGSETEVKEMNFEGIKFGIVKENGKKIEITKESDIKKILERIENKAWKISKIEKKQAVRNPKPPFITSTLQQTAANKFGYSAKKIMTIAQKLYESGDITYMRTDSTNIIPQERAKIRKFIEKKYGNEYLNEKDMSFVTKSKNAQEAHEAIRPTNAAKVSSDLKLKGEHAKLYDLIRARAIATQMKPAILEVSNIEIDLDKYTFAAEGQRVIFDGFLKIYPERISENILPPLKEGDELFLKKIFAEQKFTKPKARYTEATLIKTLEAYGVGRPSTYASIISTIISRKYVEKDGKYLFPTPTGRVVNKLLVKYFPNIVDTGFTAEMEEDLDQVAEGEKNWVEIIDLFFKPFIKDIEKGDKTIDKEEFTVLGPAPSKYKCPVCGSKLVEKISRFGSFYSCSRFPECDGKLNLDGKSEEDMKKEAKKKLNSKEFKESYMPAPKTKDGRDYELKKGRYGEFWAHPDYPKTKDIKSLELRPEKIIELYGKPPKTKDGKDYLLRKGRFGEFWAHPDYPEVKDIKKIVKKK